MIITQQYNTIPYLEHNQSHIFKMCYDVINIMKGDSMNIFVQEVNFTFDETVEHLTKGLAEQKFGVLSTIPLSDKFVDKGLEFKGRIKILDVCNPIEAYSVYKIDPLAINFLPCKFVIREENDKVTIEMIRPTDLISLMNNDALTRFAGTIETQLIDVVRKIK